MPRAAQQREERGCLVEELHEVLALGCELALVQHLAGGLGAGDEHATHAVGVARLVDGAVTVGPVDFLQLAEADDGHADVLVPHGAFATHHLLDLAADDRPYFFPRAARGSAQDGGMFLRAKRSGEWIVVEADELGPPHDHRRVAGAQQDARGGAQGLRPGPRITQRSVAPPVRPDELAHGAAARKELQAGFGRACLHGPILAAGRCVHTTGRRRPTRGIPVASAAPFSTAPPPARAPG